MNFRVYERRERRGMLNQGLRFGTLGYSIANYSTEAVSDKKLDLNFDNEIFNKINCIIPDPLKKNLADTVITNEIPANKPEKMPPDPSDFFYPQEFHQESSENHQNHTDNIYSSLQGISSFFSNFFGAITGSMFQRRAKSPVTEYFDCFDHDTGYNSEMAPPTPWQSSKMHDQNKNIAPEPISFELNDNMSSYRATVAQCEQKLTAVKSLLPSKHVVAPPKLRRRPKREFVPPGSVQQSSEDNFAIDDYVSLPNSDYIEYISVVNNQIQESATIDGPKLQIEQEINLEPELQNTEIVTLLPEAKVKEIDKSDSKTSIKMPEAQITTNTEIPVLDQEETLNITEESSGKPVELTEEKSTNAVIPDIEIAQNENTINKETLPIICQIPLKSTTEIIPEIQITQNEVSTTESNVVTPICEKPQELGNQVSKEEIISSVEDKMAKLKLMLQEKRKKTSQCSTSADTMPNSIEVIDKPDISRSHNLGKCLQVDNCHNKKFKNPHRLSDKRKKSKLRSDIEEDMRFAHEIDSDDISSVESSPRNSNLQIPHHKGSRRHRMASAKIDSSSDTSKSPNTSDYFDELKGRFHSSSTTDSEDSFQIVFADNPKKNRRPSDCESEDSFIVFEDSPDSCYTSNDVFGDRETESESNYSDSDDDLSDSGCGIDKLKLSQHLSRTVSDLTDDSLYEDARKSKDEIDCAVRTFDEIPSKNICDINITNGHKTKVTTESTVNKNSALDSHVSDKNDRKSDDQENIVRNQDSVNNESDKHTKKKTGKKVQFSAAPPKVHVMRVWAFAARQARAGHWERHALDRERFKRRIADVEMAISWVLKPQHRSRVMFQRFMPWWNQMKRLEIAEKKRLKAEEEKRMKEEEERRIKEEERKIREEEERIAREEEERRKEEERIKLEEERIKQEADNDAKKIEAENKEYAIYPERESEMETSSSYSTDARGKEKEENFAPLPEKLAEKMAGGKEHSKREYSEFKNIPGQKESSERECSEFKNGAGNKENCSNSKLNFSSFAKYGTVCLVTIFALFCLPTNFGG